MSFLRRRWAAVRARGDDAGSGGGISLLLLAGGFALLLVVGLVVDGGAKAQALDRAGQIASEAARAGAQSITDQGGRVNERASQAAVQAYLAAAQVSGNSYLNENRVVVTVTITQPTIFVSMVGIDTVTVTGTGYADVIYSSGSNP